ncbi:MAG: TIGR03905 family TSCPD domain-containing protein [Oscillospiraceae bacterium]|nr:TIGR03905 family TSCPD domain-containing protein [Oscillospiraceae bacterium]
MEYIYEPEGVCPMQIKFNINGNVITDIEFFGGCNGNLKVISKLLDGKTVEEIEENLLGNTCGRKQTSCGDQLAKAVRAAYEETKTA